jgi:hypothetical protein
MALSLLHMVPEHIDSTTPMVLLYRCMVCGECDMFSTMILHQKGMGGLWMYHGMYYPAHGTCRQCLAHAHGIQHT